MGDPASRLGGNGSGQRPSTDAAIFKRMTEADAAPFKSLTPDPWPKVQEMVLAAM